MVKEETILDDFLYYTPQKGKLYNALIISYISYVAMVIITLAVDLDDFSQKDFDWLLSIILLIIPVTGIIFHLFSKKAGWIINCLYYVSVVSIIGYVYSRNIEVNLQNSNWLGPLLMILPLTATTILLSRPIRKYFNVDSKLCIIVVSVSLLLTIVFLFPLFK
jgi:presenilin-like A22 family membrane protease